MMNIQDNGNGSKAHGEERISYSKLSTFEQCPRQFFIKYEQKKRPDDITSLPLEIGTISHYGKELIGKALMAGETPDYEHIKSIIIAGFDEFKIRSYIDENGNKVGALDNWCDMEGEMVHVPGLEELKKKYFFEWVEPDNKSGMNYDKKLEIYFNNFEQLENDMKETGWRPIACEPEFEFSYKGLFKLYGFIDRIDINEDGDYRVVDYKSSKKVFDDKDIKTPMQMFIYTLAIENMYGKTPIAHHYDFIFIDKIQEACSKGYYKRGEKKLIKLWEDLCTCRETGVFKPKPTPLCHWCEYCATNPNALHEFKHECQYYSKWTPTNKTFEKNKEFDETVVDTEKKAKEFWF